MPGFLEFREWQSLPCKQSSNVQKVLFDLNWWMKKRLSPSSDGLDGRGPLDWGLGGTGSWKDWGRGGDSPWTNSLNGPTLPTGPFLASGKKHSTEFSLRRYLATFLLVIFSFKDDPCIVCLIYVLCVSNI